VRIEQSADAFERLGWCYFRLSQFDRSLAAYRQAVAIDATHWPSWNGIGVNMLNTWLLGQQQDQQARREARDAFRQSLRINPDQQKVVLLMSNYGLDR
jgi:tetratricopeptide (TPR) repeat protein